MKLSWMFAISLFPIFGAILYTVMAAQPGTKVMYYKLKELKKQTQEHVTVNRETLDRLSAESSHMSSLAHYLYKYDASPVYDGTRVKYFPLGDEQFPAIVEEMKKAEKFLFVEFFIVSEGYMWDTIHDILKEKAQQGVEVRFMYDGTDVLFNLPSYYPRILEEEGIRCKMFAPIKPLFLRIIITGITGRSWWWTAKQLLPAESILRTSISTGSCGSATGRTAAF